MPMPTRAPVKSINNVYPTPMPKKKTKYFVTDENSASVESAAWTSLILASLALLF
jgi:hypothetical protein